jgi:hypothetical protein
VPITVRNNLIIVPVDVEGHALDAVLDTGSQYTVMNMDVANRLFGLTPSSPGLAPVTESNGDKSITVYRRRFDELTFEGVQVKDLNVYLLPNQIAVHDRSNSLLRGRSLVHMGVAGARFFEDGMEGGDDTVSMPDVIIGMDVLRHLHVYFAAKEKRLYITDAVSGESALFHFKQ